MSRKTLPQGAFFLLCRQMCTVCTFVQPHVQVLNVTFPA